MAAYYEAFEAEGRHVVLRNPEPEDAQGMIDLVNALDGETVFLSREPGEFEMTLEKEQAYLAERKASEDSLFLVCEADGVLMGSCQAACGSRRRVSHKATVGIALRQAVCGLGIGGKMMEALIAWGKGKGLSHLELEVDCGNLPGLKLYLRLGFLVGGRKYRARRLADGSFRDDYYMYLPLDK